MQLDILVVPYNERNKNIETSFDMWLYTSLLFNYENVPNKVSSHHTYKMILILNIC